MLTQQFFTESALSSGSIVNKTEVAFVQPKLPADNFELLRFVLRHLKNFTKRVAYNEKVLPMVGDLKNRQPGQPKPN